MILLTPLGFFPGENFSANIAQLLRNENPAAQQPLRNIMETEIPAIVTGAEIAHTIFLP
jgi:hypothetical protein